MAAEQIWLFPRGIINLEIYWYYAIQGLDCPSNPTQFQIQLLDLRRINPISCLPEYRVPRYTSTY